MRFKLNEQVVIAMMVNGDHWHGIVDQKENYKCFYHDGGFTYYFSAIKKEATND